MGGGTSTNIVLFGFMMVPAIKALRDSDVNRVFCYTLYCTKKTATALGRTRRGGVRKHATSLSLSFAGKRTHNEAYIISAHLYTATGGMNNVAVGREVVVLAAAAACIH